MECLMGKTCGVIPASGTANTRPFKSEALEGFLRKRKRLILQTS